MSVGRYVSALCLRESAGILVDPGKVIFGVCLSWLGSKHNRQKPISSVVTDPADPGKRCQPIPVAWALSSVTATDHEFHDVNHGPLFRAFGENP